MYAIFETGGKQYKAAAGDVIRVEKLPDAEGGKIGFDRVLAINDDKETQIGTPYLDAATVNATVVATGRGDKVIVYKYKAKKGYRRKQGHRQPFTEVEIESVSLGGKTVFKKKETPKKPDKAEAKKDAEEEKPADAKEPDKAAPKKDDVKDAGAKAAETKEDTGKPGKAADKKDGETVDAKKSDAADDKAALKLEKVADVEKSEKAADAEAKEAKAAPDEKKTDKAAAAPKMTKADIMAKLDELGASYAKSAKKDELLAILAEAEKK
jgi:large subunit ribosomal protein L21